MSCVLDVALACIVRHHILYRMYTWLPSTTRCNRGLCNTSMLDHVEDRLASERVRS